MLTADNPSKNRETRRVGNLLIILNGGYRGGEIAVRSGDRGVFFDPASARHDQFFIAR
jgi:hypothetical protein